MIACLFYVWPTFGDYAKQENLESNHYTAKFILEETNKNAQNPKKTIQTNIMSLNLKVSHIYR